MKDISKLADSIAHYIETTTNYLKLNWKSLLVVTWMLLVTYTMMQQRKDLSEAASFNQVANMRMSVDDIRYSLDAMEADVEKMQRTISKLDNSVNNMQSTVNRIHSQVRHTTTSPP